MKKTIITIFILLINCFFLKAQSEWEEIGQMERPVSGAQAVVLNNKIYVIGGYSSIEQKNVNWIQEYDPITNSWKQVGEMKANRKGFFMAISSQNIFFIGGIEETSPYVYNLEFWNPTNPGVTQILGNESNFNRVFATGNYNENKLFLFGGFKFSNLTDTSALSYFIKYDLAPPNNLIADNFIYGPNDFPSQQMSALVGNSIYIFGGTHNGLLKTIYEYKIATNEYLKFGEELPEPRAGGAAVKDKNSDNVYLIGGFNEQANSALSDVEIFNPFLETGKISSGPSLINARRNTSGVFYNNSIYIFGGLDVTGTVVKQIEKINLTPVTSVEDDYLANDFVLKQNYPNPFNPSTVISYNVPRNSYINLKVYDVLGNEVDELINEYKQSGNYEFKFNANTLPSGVYFYQLISDNFSETKKMVIVK